MLSPELTPWKNVNMIGFLGASNEPWKKSNDDTDYWVTCKPQYQHTNSPHWYPYYSYIITWEKLFNHQLRELFCLLITPFILTICMFGHVQGIVIILKLRPGPEHAFAYWITLLLGSLSNYDGNGNKNVTKQKVLISKTMPCMCVSHFGTFLCRSLKNNNVKWPNSKFCGDRSSWIVQPH